VQKQTLLVFRSRSIFSESRSGVGVKIFDSVGLHQCCHCWFFFTRSVFFVLSGVLGFLLKIWVFLTLVKFHKCMLYYCIFH